MKHQIQFKDQIFDCATDRVEVGMQGPDVRLVNPELQEVKLSDFRERVLVLSSLPSIDTGVCQAQTRRFNEAAGRYDDVAILTISMDLPFAQGRFCAAEGLDHVHMLSDHRYAEFGEQYGFLVPALRLLARGVVVLDQDRKIVYTEYVAETGNEPDYEKALAAIDRLVKA